MVLLQNFFKQFTAETKQKLVICISCSLPASWQVPTRQTIFILHECFAHLIIIVFHIMSTSLNWIPSRSDIRCISNLWWWSQCAYVNVFESEFLSYLTVRAQCREMFPIGWKMAAGAAAGLTLPRTESFPCLFNAIKWVIEQLNGVIMMSN